MNNELMLYFLGIIDSNMDMLEMTEEDIKYLSNQKVQNVLPTIKLLCVKMACVSDNLSKMNILCEYLKLTSSFTDEEIIYLDNYFSNFLNKLNLQLEKLKPQKVYTNKNVWKWKDEQ